MPQAGALAASLTLLWRSRRSSSSRHRGGAAGNSPSGSAIRRRCFLRMVRQAPRGAGSRLNAGPHPGANRVSCPPDAAALPRRTEGQSRKPRAGLKGFAAAVCRGSRDGEEIGGPEAGLTTLTVAALPLAVREGPARLLHPVTATRVTASGNGGSCFEAAAGTLRSAARAGPRRGCYPIAVARMIPSNSGKLASR